MNKKFKHSPTNKGIRAPVVRLIHDGENVVMPISKAISIAQSAELDLVQMNDETIPTCKIMNYAKHVFETKKQNKTKVSVKTQIKEMQIKPFIADNDSQIKANQIQKFLEKKCEVRIRIKIVGRDKAWSTEHHKFLLDFCNRFTSLAKVEQKGTAMIVLKPITQ